MEEIVKEKLIKELSQKIECDAKGFIKVKSLNEIVKAVDDTVVRYYKDQLRNLAAISKGFIATASTYTNGDSVDAIRLVADCLAYVCNHSCRGKIQ